MTISSAVADGTTLTLRHADGACERLSFDVDDLAGIDRAVRALSAIGFGIEFFDRFEAEDAAELCQVAANALTIAGAVERRSPEWLSSVA